MQKKLLILTDKKGPSFNYLVEYVSKNIENTANVETACFSDLKIYFDETGLLVRVGRKNIKSYDLVYVRRVDHSLSSFAGTLAISLNYLGIKYFDKWLSEIGATGDEMTSLIKLYLAGFPVISTTFSLTNLMDFKTPFICKEINTQHSKGIFTIRKPEDLENLPEINEKGRKLYYLHQKFIPIQKEYRLLVMGDNVVSVQKMYRDLNDFSAKIDYNKKEEFLDINQIDPTARELAVRAAKTLNIQVAGVDIAYEKGTNKLWLLEVNPGPGFTYDVKTSPEIPELVRFLKEELEN